MDTEAETQVFKGRHFDRTVILLCVRWYLAYNLSLRNLQETMAERDISVDHATINRWGDYTYEQAAMEQFAQIISKYAGLLKVRHSGGNERIRSHKQECAPLRSASSTDGLAPSSLPDRSIRPLALSRASRDCKTLVSNPL